MDRLNLYAIEIQEKDLALITLLNQGVTPSIEEKTTWFIFDATWNSEFPNGIISEEAFLETYEAQSRPTIYRI